MVKVLTVTPVTVPRSGLFPSSVTYPGPAVYPGKGTTLAATAA